MEQNNALTGQGVEPESKPAAEPSSEERPSAEQSTMETLLEEQGLVDLPKTGEVRVGVIAAIGENEILVSVGTKSEGVISGRELEQIPAEERAAFTVGSEIPVYVVTPEDTSGNVVLSYQRAREEKDWLDAEKLLSDAKPFDSKIIGYNKGGLLVPLGRLRGFVPASQISLVRRAALGGDTPDQRWGKMVGEPVKVRVIEVDRERHRLILSERAALQETRESLKDRLLSELKEGDVRTGRVTSVADFGAFVNIDGADGLVHLSEISWERINHPNEVLRVGQEVQAKVISVDHERRRIGLSIRQLQEDPWMRKVKGLREGQLVEGKITHLTKFGAFARLDEDLEGLIHISELSEHRINHPKEVVKEGETVTLRVIKIDPERRRIGLSRRKVDSPAYSDLDWKMALSEEVQEVKAEHEVSAEASTPEGSTAEAPSEASMAEAATEAPEAKAPEQPAEAVEEPKESVEEAPAEAPAEEKGEEAAPEAPVEIQVEAPAETTEVSAEAPEETQAEAPTEATEVSAEAPEEIQIEASSDTAEASAEEKGEEPAADVPEEASAEEKGEETAAEAEPEVSAEDQAEEEPKAEEG
jgi:small subunit ribosomal protein S1